MKIRPIVARWPVLRKSPDRSSSMDRCERDRVAELFEPTNMVTLNASGIQFVKVVCSEIPDEFCRPNGGIATPTQGDASVPPQPIRHPRPYGRPSFPILVGKIHQDGSLFFPQLPCTPPKYPGRL